MFGPKPFHMASFALPPYCIWLAACVSFGEVLLTRLLGAYMLLYKCPTLFFTRHGWGDSHPSSSHRFQEWALCALETAQSLVRTCAQRGMDAYSRRSSCTSRFCLLQSTVLGSWRPCILACYSVPSQVLSGFTDAEDVGTPKGLQGL
jgi:hypothetical protein